MAVQRREGEFYLRLLAGESIPRSTMAYDTKLWIGGSSGLARTYFNAFTSDNWVLLGLEEDAPDWFLPVCPSEKSTSRSTNSNSSSSGNNKPYVACDLSTLAVSNQRQSRTDRLAHTVSRLESAIRRVRSSGPLQQSDDNGNNRQRQSSSSVKRYISHIVVGIRPPLVTFRNNHFAEKYCQDLMTGFSLLLHALTVKFDVKTVIHVSSIAAVDHIPRQHLRSVREQDPRFTNLRNPYDRFKRGCEELTELVCTTGDDPQKTIRFTSVRLGAIFSDTPRCIQCNALSLQCFTGPYLKTPIDCNSARNAASLIHLMLSSVHTKPLLPIYNYTRCISSYPEPVPYGEYLVAYRKAYNLDWIPLLLPGVAVKWCVVIPFHWFTVILSSVLLYFVPALAPPFLQSIDYLLQVTLNEHSFDMRETERDFPIIRTAEESMETCFRRRSAQLAKGLR